MSSRRSSGGRSLDSLRRLLTAEALMCLEINSSLLSVVLHD
jgi:hypothetical protein